MQSCRQAPLLQAFSRAGEPKRLMESKAALLCLQRPGAEEAGKAATDWYRRAPLARQGLEKIYYIYR